MQVSFAKMPYGDKTNLQVLREDDMSLGTISRLSCVYYWIPETRAFAIDELEQITAKLKKLNLR